MFELAKGQSTLRSCKE